MQSLIILNTPSIVCIRRSRWCTLAKQMDMHSPQLSFLTSYEMHYWEVNLNVHILYSSLRSCVHHLFLDGSVVSKGGTTKYYQGQYPFCTSLFIEALRANKNGKNCSVPNSGWFLCWLILCYSYIYTVIQFKIFLTHNFKNNVYGTQATSGFQDSLMLKRVSFICPVFVEEILSTRKENQLIRNWSDPLINSLNLTLDRCDLRKLIRGQLHQFNYKE